MTISLEAYQAIQRDVDFERAASRKLASEKLHLEVEVERLRYALEEREADMHMRIRLGYDKTVADCWRAVVEEARHLLVRAHALLETPGHPAGCMKEIEAFLMKTAPRED